MNFTRISVKDLNRSLGKTNKSRTLFVGRKMIPLIACWLQGILIYFSGRVVDHFRWIMFLCSYDFVFYALLVELDCNSLFLSTLEVFGLISFYLAFFISFLFYVFAIFVLRFHLLFSFLLLALVTATCFVKDFISCWTFEHHQSVVAVVYTFLSIINLRKLMYLLNKGIYTTQELLDGRI